MIFLEKVNISKKKFHVDNQFVINPRPIGQFYLQQICDLACSGDYEVELHGPHNGYEISYIVSGEGIFQRGPIKYKVSAGDLFLISIGDYHYIRSSNDNPMRYYCMSFSFNKSDPHYPNYKEVEEFFDHFENPLVKDDWNVSQAFIGALNEMANWDNESEEIMISYLSQIIINTYRTFTRKKRKQYYSSLKIDAGKSFVYEIINCIDANFTTISLLKDLSDRLGYSYSYMSSTFSETMGETIKQYYTRRRFEWVKQMLAEGMSIADIAEHLGFKTVHSFNRAFSNYFGQPPGKFRSQLK